MSDIPWRRVAVLFLVVLAAVVGAKVTFDESGLPPVAPAPTASATPDSLPAPYKKGRVAPLRASPSSDLADDLRDEPNIAGKAEGAAKTNELARNLGRRGPLAKSIAPSCRTDYSGHVYSDRAPGVIPTEFVLHYTVSHNAPGWGDVYAIRDYFTRTRVGSAHFLIDFEGHCLKMVPGAEKAWTQGNANSYAYSVEIIAYGSEPASAWKSSPLFKQQILARLVRGVMDAHRLPIRWVDPDGCVFPPGLTDHDHLECGNDHHDVSPHFPRRLFLRQLRSVR